MAEIDYQVALLLQHRFEQEAKKPKEFKSDLELAKALQDQFQTESDIELPKNGLVYKTSKSLNSSKCLIDPSWEIIDPTPDVHILFTSFNDRFFWGKLVAVCVSWSKRMTTCAGICSYQGRGGLCSITLSEPLLKLRPRKDLVETLLHEMIHAYLFVTDNNRDRDGHGPEFHKHMYRINKETGTNITVYHDFHDEVRLYQQHWWRCDGPCRNWRPYFGTVRRATNRAPGPNDRWWGEHWRNCGGNFIKVKEPEKPDKRAPAKEIVKPKEDIRKYMSPIKGDPTTKAISKPTTSATTSTPSPANTNPLNNVRTINNNDNTKKIITVIPKAGNILEINNLTGNTSSPKGKGGGTTVRNNSNTIVINKKPSTSTKTDTVTTVKPESLEPSQAGLILSDTPVNTVNTDYSTVRNHWLNKYPNSTNGTKRTVSSNAEERPEKISKLTDGERNDATANCPVCLEPVILTDFNDHLDQCLEKPKKEKCIVCGREVPLAEYEIHVTKCSEENFDQARDDLEQKLCTVCKDMISITEFDIHAEKCLLKLYGDIQEAFGDTGDYIECLTCGRNIRRDELNGHLEVCTGFSQIVIDDDSGDELIETELVAASGSEKIKKFDCPFCMVLVPEEEMNDHIDSCLRTISTSPERESNKSDFVKFLLDDDF